MPLATMADATLTTRPPPWRRITGATARTQFQMPFTLTDITRSHSASAISSNGWGRSAAKSAALLTRMSTRPKRASAASTIARVDSLSLTSVCTPSTLSGAASFSAAESGIDDVGHHDPRALGQEATRVAKADAGGPAGDDRHLVLKPHSPSCRSLGVAWR